MFSDVTVKSRDGVEMTYVKWIPAAVPPGQVLVHNNVQPARRNGTRGFRYWLQAPSDRLEVCRCKWAPELPQHYRHREQRE